MLKKPKNLDVTDKLEKRLLSYLCLDVSGFGCGNGNGCRFRVRSLLKVEYIAGGVALDLPGSKPPSSEALPTGILCGVSGYTRRELPDGRNTIFPTTQNALPMRPSSPYTPDRSLLLAIGILAGGLLLCAGGAYVASSLSGGSGGGGIAGGSGYASAPSGSAVEGARRQGGASPIAGGGVPAWAGSGRSSVSPGPFAPDAAQGGYEVDPDLGQADLGAPSVPSGGGLGGASIADAGTPDEGGPIGGAPGGGPSSSAPDVGGWSAGEAAPGGGGTGWQSEARALASRSRALSREVARLNREEASSGAAQRERAEQPSGEASTASSQGGAETNNPGTPDNPDQVPLGGAEWLAAAGAAYALNRLREDGEDELQDV